MVTGSTGFRRQRSGLAAFAWIGAFGLVLAAQGLAGAVDAADVGPDADRTRLVALQQADVRVQQVFFRLVRANVALCDRQARSIGTVLHARTTYEGRYRTAAQALFGFPTEVAVSGLVSGGPAEHAGVRPNEGIQAIEGSGLRSVGVQAVAEADQAIAAGGSDGSVTLTLTTGKGARTLSVPAVAVCAGRAEVQVSSARNAGTDGTTIQVSSGLLNEIVDDNQLAAVIAHELAHAVLDHPARLTSARVSRGLFAEFGRNRRLILQTETEADRLSVYLLANAGFDPRAAIAFWQGPGSRIGAGILASGTHMRPASRIRLLNQELERMPAAAAPPITPAWFASRLLPLG